MDATDVKLLELLQHNAEMTIQELSAEVHLSTTPTMVFVTLNTHDQEKIRIIDETIQQIPEVVECYRMSGEIDYLLKVVLSDIEGYDNFYKRLIDKVQFAKVTSHFAIEEIKHTTEMPLGLIQ